MKRNEINFYIKFVKSYLLLFLFKKLYKIQILIKKN